MQDFRFKIEHRKRDLHQNAVALSKMTNNYMEIEDQGPAPPPINLQFLIGETRKEFEDLMLKCRKEMSLDNSDVKRKLKKLRKADRDSDTGHSKMISLITLRHSYQPGQLANEQNRDHHLRTMKDVLNKQIPIDSPGFHQMTSEMPKVEKAWFKRNYAKLKINEDKALVKIVNDVFERPISQLIIPHRRVDEILRAAHDDSGHMSTKKTSASIFKKFDWPGALNDIEQHCNTCLNCQGSKRLRVKPKMPLEPIHTRK